MCDFLGDRGQLFGLCTAWVRELGRAVRLYKINGSQHVFIQETYHRTRRLGMADHCLSLPDGAALPSMNSAPEANVLMCAFHVPYRPLVVLPSKHKNQTIDFQMIMALLLLPFPVPLAMAYYSNGHTAQGRHRTPYVRVRSTS